MILSRLIDMTAYIEIKHLAKSFGKNNILKDVSLSVKKGQSMALIGSGASGKTLFVKSILGLHDIDCGSIFIDGVDMINANNNDRAEIISNIGVLFQQNALFDSKTVWENISFRLLQQGQISNVKARDKAVDLLKKVGLDADVHMLYPSDLSGGMQKRVGLARAISTDPKILILDDPTAGLDPILANVIDNLINDIVKDNNVTAIAITGVMENIEQRYNDLALLHDGIISWCGKTADINNSDNQYLHQMING